MYSMRAAASVRFFTSGMKEYAMGIVMVNRINASRNLLREGQIPSYE